MKLLLNKNTWESHFAFATVLGGDSTAHRQPSAKLNTANQQLQEVTYLPFNGAGGLLIFICSKLVKATCKFACGLHAFYCIAPLLHHIADNTKLNIKRSQDLNFL